MHVALLFSFLCSYATGDGKGWGPPHLLIDGVLAALLFARSSPNIEMLISLQPQDGKVPRGRKRL